MRHTAPGFWKIIGAAGVLAALAAWPGIGQAQLGDLTGTLANTVGTDTNTVGGLLGQTQTTGGTQAAAARAIVNGVVTSLADAGTLSDPSQPIGSGAPLGSISGLLSAEALHSAAMGWTDQVVSQASLGNVAMTVAGMGISADFIQSTAQAVSGAGATGLSAIEGLRIGGVSISPSGAPNQVISLPGLSVVLNEQVQTAGGIVVNALRVTTLDGLTDVVLASARAGI